MPAPILEVSGLSKKFCRNPHRSIRYFLRDIGREILRRPPPRELAADESWALRDISFAVEPGEVLGVIGHNGAGKSTLINLISGVVRPTSGQIVLRTRRVALMDHGGGITPSLTGRENIRKLLSLHGCQASSVPAKEEAVIEFAGIGAFIDAPVGTYSLGMRQRLSFSIYSQLEPDLFIVDEAISGGDLRFRQKFADYLKSFVIQGGSLLLCSHELFSVQTLCKRCILLDHGRLVASGNTVEVIEAYHKLEEKRHKLQTQSAPVAKHRSRTYSGEAPAAEVEIESVVVHASGEQPLFPGDSVSLELTCHASGPTRRVLWGIEIFQQGREPLAAICLGFDPVPIRLVQGPNVFVCTIPKIPLAAGVYELRARIMDLETSAMLASFGDETAATQLRLSSRGDEISNMMAYKKYIVHLESEWEVLDSGGNSQPKTLDAESSPDLCLDESPLRLDGVKDKDMAKA